MNNNIKKIFLSTFLAMPILISPTASAASGDNAVEKETPKIETRSVRPPSSMDGGGSDYWAYTKRVHYAQASPNFPATKHYSEYNSKYGKWFTGTLYFESSYWDGNQGVYIAYYSGGISRQN